MVSLLIKSISNLKISKSFFTFAIQTRGIITKNEEVWTKENSLKLIQEAKKEKGPELKIDLNSPQLFYENSKELDDAKDVVKRIFSLEYASRNDFKRYEEDLIHKIFQRLPIENDSLEKRIALHTLNIRRMCQNLEEFKGKNKKVEFFLYRQIHRRDRLMVQLFYKDNKRYEWLKEKLNLQDYKLKETQPYKRVTKYEKYINEVMLINREKRLSKLHELKNEFEKQKNLFFKERDNILLEIQKEVKDLGFTNINFPEMHSN